MLTKQDLQQIGEVTRTIIIEEVKPLGERVAKLEQGQKTLIRKVNKLANDQSVMLRVLNNESFETRTRVDRIEKNLDLPPLKLPY